MSNPGEKVGPKDIAKVRVAGSNPVIRSKEGQFRAYFWAGWPDALSRMWAAARGTSPMTLLNQRHYVATAMLSRPAR